MPRWDKNGTWNAHSLQDSVRLNETDVAIRLLYASYEKNTGVDFVWDMGRVHAELVVHTGLPSLGDLFTSKIVLGLATLATVAVIMIAFAVYLAVTIGKPMLALFQGISLVRKCCS